MKKLVLILLLSSCSALGDQVLTHAERICALTILGEARGEGKLGMFAVACVIQQRVVQRKLTPAKVCLQPDQFDTWTGKKERDLWHLWKAKEMMYARELARYLCNKNIRLFDVTNGADHFCHINTNNYWTRKSKPVAIIGNHKFFRLND